LIVDYAARVEAGDVLNATADTAGAQRAAEIQHDALLIASAIVAFAGLLIAGQAFGRFLTRRPSDSSTLSSIGMTTGQRTVASWLPGLAAAGVGALFVIPIAVALSPLLPRGVARRADPDVGFHTDLMVIGPGVAATFAIGAASALIAAGLWSGRSTATGSVASISAISAAARHLHLSPAPTMGSRFALEPGHGPRRAPVIPMLVGASAAIAILVGALVVTHSLDGLLSTPARYGATWDLQVTGGDRTIEIGEQIADDDRVDGVALAVSGELGVGANGGEAELGFAIGMSSIKGSVDPVILDGRAPVGQNEALLGTDTMASLGVGLGDEVVVSGPLGERTMVVVGRTIVPVLGSQRTDSGIVVPLQTMVDLGGTETVADIDVQPAAFVNVAAGENVEAVGRDVEATGAALDGPFRQSGVSVLDEVRVVPLYVAAFTAMLGALAVFHALVVTARRRRIDLATMRALGYRPRQAASVISWQGGVAAAAALVIGVPVGLVGGRFLWQSIATSNNVRTVIETPWPLITLVALASILGASFLLAALPAWTAGRRRPATDLRAE
jgi:FtsX-like permease family